MTIHTLYVEQAAEDFRLAGLRLMKATSNLAKGYTLHRLEEKVAAQQLCDRAKKRLAKAIEEKGESDQEQTGR